jgi:hypothetical protein
MVSSGANVIIWCYHVMLSSGMITHPFFIFPENFTHSILHPKPGDRNLPQGKLLSRSKLFFRGLKGRDPFFKKI